MKELNDNSFLTKQFIQNTVDKSNTKRYFYLLFMQYLYQFVNDDSKISFTNGSIDITVEDIDNDVLLKKTRILKDKKDELKGDVREGAIDFVKQKGNIDNMLKELEQIEEKV